MKNNKMAAQLNLAVGNKQTERVFTALVDKYRLNNKRRLAQQADQEIAALREQIKIAYESNDTHRANRLKERKRERFNHFVRILSEAKRTRPQHTIIRKPINRAEVDLKLLQSIEELSQLVDVLSLKAKQEENEPQLVMGGNTVQLRADPVTEPDEFECIQTELDTIRGKLL